MAITREELTPTLLENTSMNKVFIDGVHKLYEVTPNEGYVLHDKGYDYLNIDEITGEETLVLGYRRTTASCTVAQFNANTREFYAVPEDSVPADQIFGATEPDHEIA